jgi:hypothetical protein
MNGRVYDPLIGRFMSADPFIQSPQNLQSHNRYAYVLNNPLAYTDPSGYFSFKKLFRTALAIAVAYFAPPLFAQYGVAVAGMNATTAMAINSAAAGALAGYVSTGTTRGALQGGLSAALFFGAGEIAAAAGANAAPTYLAHAAAGCVGAAAGGGDCGQGAAGAAFGKFTSNYINNNQLLSGTVARGVATVVAGGAGSVLAGGKFENGATTAAFGYLFNELMSGATAADRQRRAGYGSTTYDDGTVAILIVGVIHQSKVCIRRPNSSPQVARPAFFESLRRGSSVMNWLSIGGRTLRMPVTRYVMCVRLE